MEKWTLPEGWEWLPISAIVSDTNRRNPAQSPDGFFYYVDIGSIDNERGAIDDNSVKRLRGEDAPSRARKVIRKGDIVFATTRPYLKNIALVPERYDDEICSTGFCVLSSKKEKALPEYVYYAVRSSFFIDQLVPKQRGANYPAVTDSDVYETELPVPYPEDLCRSLVEQQRIVARLEALLGEVREMRALQAGIETDVGRLMEAVLGEAFPDHDKPMPEGWKVWRVEQISKKPQYGYTQSASAEPVGPKFLRITDIQNGIVDWDSVPFCEIDEAKLEKYLLKTGDIVFARSGATTGKTYLVKNPPKAAFASYLIRLQIERAASPEFVYWFFQSPYYWRQITLRGGAQPNMNATLLSQVLVPIPDDDKSQQALVAYLDAVSTEIQSIHTVVEKDNQSLDSLEQSILAQAFRGEG